jgi:hypothetical protein
MTLVESIKHKGEVEELNRALHNHIWAIRFELENAGKDNFVNFITSIEKATKMIDEALEIHMEYERLRKMKKGVK